MSYIAIVHLYIALVHLHVALWTYSVYPLNAVGSGILVVAINLYALTCRILAVAFYPLLLNFQNSTFILVCCPLVVCSVVCKKQKKNVLYYASE